MRKPNLFNVPMMSFKAHCFPTLDASLLHENAGEEFQPLYCCGTGRSSQAAWKDGEAAPPASAVQHQQEAHPNGFQRGLEAGQQEGCRLAIATIAPGRQDLIKTYGDVAQYNQQIVTESAQHIIKLALAVVQKVLSTPSALTPEDLTGIHADLLSSIGDAYRLTLCFHPDDLESLQHVSRCTDLAWLEQSTIAIERELELPKGTVKAYHTGDQRPALEKQMAKNLQELFGLECQTR